MVAAEAIAGLSGAAADLAVAFALRPRVRAYRVAARAGINPVVLSRILNGFRTIEPDLALRLIAALLAEEAGLHEAVAQ